MLAPGYQGALFAGNESESPSRWRVVEASGRRAASTTSLVLAIGQARALAEVAGRAWIVADDEAAVEVTHHSNTFGVVPCGPGWPATAHRILTKHGNERSKS